MGADKSWRSKMWILNEAIFFKFCYFLCRTKGLDVSFLTDVLRTRVNILSTWETYSIISERNATTGEANLNLLSNEALQSKNLDLLFLQTISDYLISKLLYVHAGSRNKCKSICIRSSGSARIPNLQGGGQEGETCIQEGQKSFTEKMKIWKENRILHS